jgi:hypothetical protein
VRHLVVEHSQVSRLTLTVEGKPCEIDDLRLVIEKALADYYRRDKAPCGCGDDARR